jgi:hypothetical protein
MTDKEKREYEMLCRYACFQMMKRKLKTQLYK